MEVLLLICFVILSVTMIYLINKINSIIRVITLQEEVLTLLLKNYKNSHTPDEVDQFILNFIEDK